MRTYAYFRMDELSPLNESFYYDNIKKIGYLIPKSRTVFERVDIKIPLKFRSRLINLIKYTLESEDVLMVNGIDSLGSNFNEIYSTLNFIFDKEIRLVCLDFSNNEIKNDFKKIFLHLFKICSEFEKKIPLENKNTNKILNKVGRPEILNEIQKKEVLEKFKKGQSIYSLAKEYSVTRTVIQRVISMSADSFRDK